LRLADDDATVVASFERHALRKVIQRVANSSQVRRWHREDEMPRLTLEGRVELLEKTMNGPRGLNEQVGQLRADLTHLRLEVTDFRGEFLQFRDETRSEFSAIRAEMRSLNAETRVHARVLHEEVLSRIALLDEGRNGRSQASRGRSRKK
jgi:hypothetical protein